MDINWIDAIVSAAITTPAVSGLLGWLGHKILIQETAKHNQELETLKASYATQLETYKNDLATQKQLLQAEIDKTVLVTRVHFETEFKALKDIFEKLTEVRLQVVGLRPFFSITSGQETDEDRKKRLREQLITFESAYNDLLRCYENQQPFYPQEIYENIESCRMAANREVYQIRTSGDEIFTPTWYEKGQKNQGEFLAAYERVTHAIRSRIVKLAVMRS
jgi:hypothetical protein